MELLLHGSKMLSSYQVGRLTVSEILAGVHRGLIFAVRLISAQCVEKTPQGFNPGLSLRAEGV